MRFCVTFCIDRIGPTNKALPKKILFNKERQNVTSERHKNNFFLISMITIDMQQIWKNQEVLSIFMT